MPKKTAAHTRRGGGKASRSQRLSVWKAREDPGQDPRDGFQQTGRRSQHGEKFLRITGSLQGFKQGESHRSAEAEKTR